MIAAIEGISQIVGSDGKQRQSLIPIANLFNHKSLVQVSLSTNKRSNLNVFITIYRWDLVVSCPKCLCLCNAQQSTFFVSFLSYPTLCVLVVKYKSQKLYEIDVQPKYFQRQRSQFDNDALNKSQRIQGLLWLLEFVLSYEYGISSVCM